MGRTTRNVSPLFNLAWISTILISWPSFCVASVANTSKRKKKTPGKTLIFDGFGLFYFTLLHLGGDNPKVGDLQYCHNADQNDASELDAANKNELRRSSTFNVETLVRVFLRLLPFYLTITQDTTKLLRECFLMALYSLDPRDER